MAERAYYNIYYTPPNCNFITVKWSLLYLQRNIIFPLNAMTSFTAWYIFKIYICDMNKLSKNIFHLTFFKSRANAFPILILLLILYCAVLYCKHCPGTTDSLPCDSPGHTRSPGRCTSGDTSPLGVPHSQHSSRLRSRRCSGDTIAHRRNRNCQLACRLCLAPT